MSRIRPIALNLTEARVTLDVMVHITAFTRQELEEHLGWKQREVDAWGRALRKIDDAITLAQ